MKKIFVLIFIIALSSKNILSQNKYFIYLKDKSNSAFKINEPEKFLSERSINRRINQNIVITNRDIPVNATYVNQIAATGTKILGKSKWLNAVLVETSSENLNQIKKLSFVKEVDGNQDIRGARLKNIDAIVSKFDKFATEENFEYGGSLNQIEQLGVDQMHKLNYTGKGILVAVFDAGFDNLPNLDAFKHLFLEKKIIKTYDFVSNDTNVYESHWHGTAALSCIASKWSGKLVGTAPDAQIALFKTEDVASETRIEEVYWLFAAEMSDSLGVDVINSSLGYYEFDNSVQNYTYEDLNGDKTISAKAADFAVGTGMIVVNSAGNEGNNAWKRIVTPADADSVLAVGAVDLSGNPVGFSSMGPNAKNAIKPEVSAKGSSTTVATVNSNATLSSGTSFSAPLIAGMVASFKQAYPNLSAMKIRELIIKSANHFDAPDNKTGYGIPNFTRAAKLAEQYIQSLVLGNSITDQPIIVYPNPVDTSNEFTIKIGNISLPQDQKIAIYNMQGKSLMTNISTIGSLNRIIETLPSDIYILNFSYKGNSYSEKLIKN